VASGINRAPSVKPRLTHQATALSSTSWCDGAEYLCFATSFGSGRYKKAASDVAKSGVRFKVSLSAWLRTTVRVAGREANDAA
jgi:hypothetical protein